MTNNRKYGVVERKADEPRSYWLRMDDDKVLRRNRAHLVPIGANLCNQGKRCEGRFNETAVHQSNREKDSAAQNVTRTRYGRAVKPPNRLDL